MGELVMLPPKNRSIVARRPLVPGKVVELDLINAWMGWCADNRVQSTVGLIGGGDPDTVLRNEKRFLWDHFALARRAMSPTQRTHEPATGDLVTKTVVEKYGRTAAEIWMWRARGGRRLRYSYANDRYIPYLSGKPVKIPRKRVWGCLIDRYLDDDDAFHWLVTGELIYG